MSGYVFPDCLCGREDRTLAFHYKARPEGETDFAIRPELYDRKVLRCGQCGHFVSVMTPAMEQAFALSYAEGYVDATYKDAAGIAATFERIMALPPERSDNRGRADYIDEHLRRAFPGQDRSEVSLLDVGAGLCVFPAAMGQRGYAVTALDPDPRTVAHAENHVGIPSILGDVMEIEPATAFDVVTFNKVLEHIKDPVAALARVKGWLSARGQVYIELPDGTMAEPDGPGREEFFIEHHHVFSMRSAVLLAERAGFRAVAKQRLREPSTKYTLRLFVEPADR